MTRKWAYYNEHDASAAAWIRELIRGGHVADGEVDERSIEDVCPDDVRGFVQCHWFAGIAGWSLALRHAGWDDTRPVWTGSCPCQPFSTAGAGKGFADERHLWPDFFHLIEQCRPATVFGEQVAGPDGLVWLDLVQTDLEAAGYAVGAADLCAAGVGSPHIRQRLYWVADGHQHGSAAYPVTRPHDQERDAEPCGSSGWMGDADRNRAWRDRGAVHSQVEAVDGKQRADDAGAPSGDLRPGPLHGHWRDADWLGCRDGKWRPVSARAQPMADGIPESLGRVRDEVVKALEGEVNAWELESGIGRTEALRDLWNAAREEAPRVWAAGGIPGLHEASFLLAFMRQLAQQGWGIQECLSVPREEVPEGRLRVLWSDIRASCASHRHGLEEQRRGQYPDALRVLSSVLARHAHQAWEIAHAAYAESQFPLVHGARGRVARLRGYGNAIVPQVAEAFIRASGVIA